MTRYAIALGSNLGDRLAHLREAVRGLGSIGRVTAVSRLYETDPVGGPEQDNFLNAVVVMETDLEPRQLLGFCQGLEDAAGRVRLERWGPRTLDVDIVVSDAGRYSDEWLEVPHPRAHERGFVLEPLVDVWPEAVLADGRTAAASRVGMVDQGVRMVNPDWASDDSRGTAPI